MRPVMQKSPRYENRTLLDLCHGAPCFLELGAIGCGTNPSVPCHSDMLEHGRGTGYKTHDCLAVPGCPACHAWFTRKNLGQDGYREAWAKAMAKWLVYLWTNALVRINA